MFSSWCRLDAPQPRLEATISDAVADVLQVALHGL
jgi:hypothetical protein